MKLNMPMLRHCVHAMKKLLSHGMQNERYAMDRGREQKNEAIAIVRCQM